MKRFLINVVLFLLPFAVGIVGIEIWLGQYPSTFQKKAAYFEAHKKDTEILVLGSSHNQSAINPAFLTNQHTANLSFGGQDFNLDAELLHKCLPQMPHLKCVVLELGYHNLETMHEGNYEKNSLYLRFYGINNFKRHNQLKDYSILMSNPKLYVTFLNPFMERPTVNQYGFATVLPAYEVDLFRFERMHFDPALIGRDKDNPLIKRHQYEDLAAYRKNRVIFENMVRTCIQKHLSVVVAITPVYQNYYAEMIPAKKKRRDDFLAYIKQKYPAVVVFDVEHDARFVPRDFSNEDHLSPVGAKKMTLMLDACLAFLNK